VLSHLGDQVAHLYNDVIPGAVATTQANAYNHADSEAASLQNNINAARDDEQQDVASLQNNIDSLHNYVDGTFRSDIDGDIQSAVTSGVQTAEANANTLVDNLTSRLAGDEATLNQLAVLTSTTLPSEITASQAAAEAAANNDVATAVQTLTGDIADAQTALQTALSNDDLALAAQITGNIDNLQTQLDTVVAKQQLDEAQIGTLTNLDTIAIPAAIAAVATSVAAITTEYDDCAVTTCDGPNNISNLLSKLLGLGGEAELLAFLAAAIHDPGGEAEAFASVASGIYTTGHALIDDLLSL
jgi:hypothetical protein